MKAPLALLALLAVAASCTSQEPAESDMEDSPEGDTPGVMSVTAVGLSFQAPSEIPSGWTTIRFSNESDLVHFAIVERLPVGQSLESHQEEIAPVFQDGMDLLAGGDFEGATARFGELPPWFGEIVFLGGPGLTAPGLVSEATVYLEPGTYLLECYVKTNGIFHSYNPDPTMYGMVHEFTVTGDSTSVEEPRASLELTISSEDGMQLQGAPRVGPQTVAVRFADQVAHENFVGHDVHVVSLSGTADVATVEAWMNWTTPTGLQTPAPAPFLGGLNEMPAGSTGYFDVTLAPGRYAFVSEVPGSVDKGMLLDFTVP